MLRNSVFQYQLPVAFIQAHVSSEKVRLRKWEAAFGENTNQAWNMQLCFKKYNFIVLK